MIEKPLVTISGKKILFKSNLNQRLSQDLPQEGVEWRRRLDSNSKSVYIDVDFVDFDVDNVERLSERLNRSNLDNSGSSVADNSENVNKSNLSTTSGCGGGTAISDETIEKESLGNVSDSIQINIEEEPKLHLESSDNEDHQADQKLQDTIPKQTTPDESRDVNQAFFNRKLLGRPILHTYWADKTDFENENQKSQFDEWIGQVQASTCTEWAIIIIEDGDFKAQLGAALFKSKLQSSASQANVSSSSIATMSQSSNFSTTSSFLDRMKKGLSTMFQSDSNSERWLILLNQDKNQKEHKVQESYSNFLKKFRNLIMASFSKQIELFEEQLRVQRELRIDKNWNFLSYFLMQEELAFAFEFLTLFDEALVQYDLLDALFTEYILTLNSNNNLVAAGQGSTAPAIMIKNEQLFEQWTSFKTWQGLCLDMNNEHSKELRRRIVDQQASLLDLRNYLFAKQCDLMLMQNQPWRVAASASLFLRNCIREHELLNIDVKPGALICWSFISALEVLQRCECYSCTSTMENYSLHTVDIWNCARKNLLELGQIAYQLPINHNKSHGSGGGDCESHRSGLVNELIAGLGPDPHGGVSYQNNEISPQARLLDALASKEKYSKHLIEISELTLGTYKHIGRKRHALLVGKELAEFYMHQQNFTRALPFLVDFEKTLAGEKWLPLLEDVHKNIKLCNENIQPQNHDQSQSKADDNFDGDNDVDKI